MSVGKSLFAYTVCAIALMIHQTRVASADELRCYDCNSNSTGNHKKICDGKAIKANKELQIVPMITNCVTYMYTVNSKTDYTVRTTNVNCTDRGTLLHDNFSVIKFNCTSCDKDLCNNKRISLSSGGVTFGFNILTLLLYTATKLINNF